MNLSEVEIPFRPIQPPKVNWVFFLLLISAFFKFRRTRHLLSHHSPCHTTSGQYGPVPCSVTYPFPTSRHCHILFAPNSCSTCLRSRIHVWSLWQGQLFFIKTNEEENNFSSYFWCSLLIFISADQLIGVWEEKPLLCFFASVTEHTYSISMQSRKRINLHLEGSFLSEDHNSDEYFCKLKKTLSRMFDLWRNHNCRFLQQSLVRKIVYRSCYGCVFYTTNDIYTTQCKLILL